MAMKHSNTHQITKKRKKEKEYNIQKWR